MPHVDGALVSTDWSAPGQSRFARPVAAITAFVLRQVAAARTPTAPRDRELRQLEDGYAQAQDAHDLERLQLADERRDVRPWGWR